MNTDKPGSDLPEVILVGNPNVGKSAIFGALTGKYVVVSNYPGTTVEVTQGTAVLNKIKTAIIDTPGSNSLVPMSEDEQVTRDILLEHSSSTAIQVCDAKNLRRALVISTQLAEMELPFILVLNMIDEARSRGIRIDPDAVSKALGVPVTSTIATQKHGIDRLISAVNNARQSSHRIKFEKRIEVAIKDISALLGESVKGKRALALTILSGDESLASWLHEHASKETIKSIESIRVDLQSKYPQPLGYVINIWRLRAIDKLISAMQLDNGHADGRRKPGISVTNIHPLLSLPIFALMLYGTHVLSSISPLFALVSLPLLILALRVFGNWGTHPVYGVGILGIVLYLTWMFVGRFGAGTAVGFMENVIFGRFVDPAAIWASNHLLPWPAAREFFIGQYGVITMAMTYAIAIVLPIVGTFFIAFGLLEDSGYLPRLAVMVDKIFKAMGLNGKAVLPMILGLGCGTMAVLTARILDTKRERVIVTLLLALGVPCSAQLGVIMGMLSSPGVPLTAMIVWLAVILLVLFKVGWLAGMLMPGKKTDFILEIPPTRSPQLGNIVIKTFARIQWYLKEAVPLFIAGTVILFTADKLHMLQGIQKIAAPVIQGVLGLPPKATEAFIVGFLRRDYGVAGLYTMARHHELNTVQMIVGLVTITLFIPCLANFMVIIKERGIKTAAAISVFIMTYAVLVGGVLNWILRATGAFR